jgi:hypothetical protein
VSLPLGRIEEANAAAQAGALVFRHMHDPRTNTPGLAYPLSGPILSETGFEKTMQNWPVFGKTQKPQSGPL